MQDYFEMGLSIEMSKSAAVPIDALRKFYGNLAGNAAINHGLMGGAAGAAAGAVRGGLTAEDGERMKGIVHGGIRGGLIGGGIGAGAGYIRGRMANNKVTSFLDAPLKPGAPQKMFDPVAERMADSAVATQNAFNNANFINPILGGAAVGGIAGGLSIRGRQSQ